MNPKSIARRWGASLLIVFAALCGIAIGVAVVSLPGCAQMGMTAPQTFNDRAYAAVLAVKAIQTNADTLLRLGKITSADAANVLKAADVATEGIKVARSYATSNPAMAASKLDAAVAALSLLTQYLAAQQPQPQGAK